MATSPTSQQSRRPTRAASAIYRDLLRNRPAGRTAEILAYTDFYHWQVFEPEFLNENKPDVLVYEVVERDLGRMMEDLEKLMPTQK